MPAKGHTAFNLFQQITGLAANFNGSVTVTSADNPPAPFVAWTLNSRDNLLAPLPAGEMSSPPNYDRRVYDAYARVNATVPPLVQAFAQDPNNFRQISPGQAIQTMAPSTSVTRPRTGKCTSRRRHSRRSAATRPPSHS